MVNPKCCRPINNAVKCCKTTRKVTEIMKRFINRINSSVVINDKSFVCSTCRLELMKISKGKLNLTIWLYRPLKYPKIHCNNIFVILFYFKDFSTETLDNDIEEILPEYDSASHDLPPKPCCSSFSSSPSFFEEINKTENINYIEKAQLIESLNDVLPLVNVSPVKTKQFFKPSLKYRLEKVKDITKGLKRKLLNDIEEPIEIENELVTKANYFDEFMNQIKLKIEKSKSYCEKIQILSVLPSSISRQDICKYFKVSQYLFNKFKEFQVEQGVLEIPKKKRGSKTLLEAMEKKVLDFYNDDEISKMLPGEQDCLNIDGEKVQKRLLMAPLHECYAEFKNRHQNEPNFKIGISKFCSLKPKNLILYGSSGVRAQSVCQKHENFKLLTTVNRMPDVLNNYKTCIQKFICEIPSFKCFLLECENCPKQESIQVILRSFLENNQSELIEYKQWVYINKRCTMKIISENKSNFLTTFSNQLEGLITHDFVAKEQSSFLKNLRNNLKTGDYLVLMDFAENYACNVQNFVQAYSFNNEQITIHPFVIYFKCDEGIQHKSFVIISESLSHDSIAVHLYIKKMIEFLKIKFSRMPPNKIIYFTDGAPQQYKNK